MNYFAGDDYVSVVPVTAQINAVIQSPMKSFITLPGNGIFSLLFVEHHVQGPVRDLRGRESPLSCDGLGRSQYFLSMYNDTEENNPL